MIGIWYIDFKGVLSVIDIFIDNIYLFGEGKFKCVGKVNLIEDNVYRLILFYIFENGCFFWMMCFEYKKIFKMILYYKFGKRVKWLVFFLEKMIGDIC